MPETEAMLTIAPLPCLSHVREHLLAGQEHALQVDIVDPVPTILGGLDRTAYFDDPDIVVQHVDPAECRHAGVDHGGDVFGKRYVSCGRLADAALPLDDPLGLDGRIEVDVSGQYPCPLAGEEHRRRLAIAPARAARACSRNQRHFPFESITHPFLPGVILSRPSRNQTGISNALHPRPYGLFLDDLPINIRPDLPAARVQT